MKSLKTSKSVYDAIQPPEELDAAIRHAVRTVALAEEETARFQWKNRWVKYAVGTAAALCASFVLAVNVSPALAQDLYQLPVIGNMARVFTFVQYEKEEEADVLNVTLPALENTGNTELEQRVNYEIQYEMNQLIEEARQRAQEYKQAFLNTGGLEEDFRPLDIYVDYTLHCNNGQTVSFVITKAETLASCYEELYFYNIDLESGRNLTMRDLLGPDYVRIVNESVKRQIEERKAADPEVMYFESDGEFGAAAFSSIREDQGFYINEAGHVVVVFEKYEIAPGFMGIQEFEILPEAQE